jgi:hypothetical protein
MTTLPERYTRRLLKNFPTATITPRVDGAHIVRVPLHLGDGWSHESAVVTFLAPVGFPSASPAYFYTDMAVRLAGDRDPAFTSCPR